MNRAAVLLSASALLLASPSAPAQSGQRPSGVTVHEEGALEGYTLFAPLVSAKTYLIDMEGRVVRVWDSDHPPGASCYLLDSGNLLRCGRVGDVAVHGGGQGGQIQEYSFDGELLWQYRLADDRGYLQHHDVEVLPDGNSLMIAWEHKSRRDAIRVGRLPDLVGMGGLWPDCVLEIKPVPPDGGEIVWEWHLFDHLIQDFEPRRPNYREDVAAHAQLVDVNGNADKPELTEEDLEELRALGYLAGGNQVGDQRADLCHTNAISYNPELDQIALSVHNFNEIWILDHSTTTEEARGHEGGRHGRGGGLLYRWGNPRSYGCGDEEERTLFGQHDVRWIPEGFPGGGNLTVYNNGGGRPDGDYSSVLELELPIDMDGNYWHDEGAPFEPYDPVWEYTAPDKESFFSSFISGAHRLPNGNTFICQGAAGRFFEVTPEGKTVWEYWNPYGSMADMPAGVPPQPGTDRVPKSVFRATRIPADHPALAGRDLTPLDPQPEIKPLEAAGS